MSDQAEHLSVRMAHAWVALYTRGLPPDRRDARRAEIASDLWEQGDDEGSLGASVLGRVLAGMPADITWWFEECEFVRKGNAMNTSYGQRVLWPQIIVGLSVLAGLVTLTGMPSAVAALLAGLMVLALLGLTRALVVNSVGTSSGKAAHMETGINHRRRTTLLIVLAVSMIVLAGTYAYAMSLEHWGDTRAIIFVSVGMVAPAVGLIALVLLVADVVRARRN